jgi:hypothetical protein
MLPAAFLTPGVDPKRIGLLIGGRKREKRNRGKFAGITLIVCHRLLLAVPQRDARGSSW